MRGLATRIGDGKGCLRVVACVVVGCGILMVWPASGWAAGTPRWRIRSVPKPAGSTNQVFNRVSCLSRTWCVAVGGPDVDYPGRLFIERWGGSRWSIQSAPEPAGRPNSGLNGVSCASRRACTAVGYFQRHGRPLTQLVERWNGLRWSIQPTPKVPGAVRTVLYSVSCSSTTMCVAVGGWDSPSGQNELAEGWNGSRWTIQKSASASIDGLDVSCPSSSACTLVDAAADASFWDGVSWSVRGNSVPSNADDITLYSVSCVSATACAAVGMGDIYYSRTSFMLSEFWNGSQWAITENATAVDLYGVSCVTARFCTAVGDVVERWNGIRWSIQNRSLPELYSVSCASPRACVAVGYRTVAGVEIPVAATYS